MCMHIVNTGTHMRCMCKNQKTTSDVGPCLLHLVGDRLSLAHGFLHQLFRGFWDLNSGHQTCAESALFTELLFSTGRKDILRVSTSAILSTPDFYGDLGQNWVLGRNNKEFSEFWTLTETSFHRLRAQEYRKVQAARPGRPQTTCSKSQDESEVVTGSEPASSHRPQPPPDLGYWFREQCQGTRQNVLFFPRLYKLFNIRQLSSEDEVCFPVRVWGPLLHSFSPWVTSI